MISTSKPWVGTVRTPTAEHRGYRLFQIPTVPHSRSMALLCRRTLHRAVRKDEMDHSNSEIETKIRDRDKNRHVPTCSENWA